MELHDGCSGMRKRPRVLATYHGTVHAAHLQGYLDEFAFRCNHRMARSPGTLFRRLLERAAKAEATLYHCLIRPGAESEAT